MPELQKEGKSVRYVLAEHVFSFLLQKKSKDHFGLEGDEESTMLEDSVSPKK